MAKALIREIREKIIKHKQKGEKEKEIQKWLMISLSSVRRIWSQFKKTGSIDTKLNNSGRKPKITEEEMKQVTEEIKINPDITLKEMIEKYKLKIKKSALSKRLIDLGYSFKKRIRTQ